MQDTRNVDPVVQRISDEISSLSSSLKIHLGVVTAEKVTAAFRSVMGLASVRRPSSNVNTQHGYGFQNKATARQFALDFVDQAITDFKTLVQAIESGGDAEFLKRSQDDLKDMEYVLRRRTLRLLRNTREFAKVLGEWADKRSVSRVR
jgi:hypothetical protein